MKALQFSGGIDSLACLLLSRGDPDVTVYYARTEAPYPDMEAHVRACCEFAELPLVIVEGNRYIPMFGYPKDTHDSARQCCARSWWMPLYKQMMIDEIEVVIRGQRNDDILQGVTHDTVEFGIVYVLPIAEWTRAQVMEFVEKEAPQLIPAHYYNGETSGHDCWDCTAFLFENEQRIANLPAGKRKFVMYQLGRLV